MIGYKSQLIKNYLKNIRKLKFSIKKLIIFLKNGHSFTWYQFKQLWKNSKKSTIFISRRYTYLVKNI